MAKRPYFVVGISARSSESPEYNLGDYLYFTYIPMESSVRFFNANGTSQGLGLGIKQIESDELSPDVPYIKLIKDIVPYLTQPTHSTNETQLANKYQIEFRNAKEVDISNSNRKYKYQPGEQKLEFITPHSKKRETFHSKIISINDVKNKANYSDFCIPYKDNKNQTQILHIRLSLGCLEAEKYAQYDQPIFDPEQLNDFKQDATIKNCKELAFGTNLYFSNKEFTNKKHGLDLLLQQVIAYHNIDMDDINSLIGKTLSDEQIKKLSDEWNQKVAFNTESIAIMLMNFAQANYFKGDKDFIEYLSTIRESIKDDDYCDRIIDSYMTKCKEYQEKHAHDAEKGNS